MDIENYNLVNSILAKYANKIMLSPNGDHYFALRRGIFPLRDYMLQIIVSIPSTFYDQSYHRLNSNPQCSELVCITWVRWVREKQRSISRHFTLVDFK